MWSLWEIFLISLGLCFFYLLAEGISFLISRFLTMVIATVTRSLAT